MGTLTHFFERTLELVGFGGGERNLLRRMIAKYPKHASRLEVLDEEFQRIYPIYSGKGRAPVGVSQGVVKRKEVKLSKDIMAFLKSSQRSRNPLDAQDVALLRELSSNLKQKSSIAYGPITSIPLTKGYAR